MVRGAVTARTQPLFILINGVLLFNWILGASFSENFIKIKQFPCKKWYSKLPSAKWWPFCFNLNVSSHLEKQIIDMRDAFLHCGYQVDIDIVGCLSKCNIPRPTLMVSYSDNFSVACLSKYLDIVNHLYLSPNTQCRIAYIIANW